MSALLFELKVPDYLKPFFFNLRFKAYLRDQIIEYEL